jgi:hypothetical protein
MNRIKIRRDTNANWTSNDPILSEGELGIVTDSSSDSVKIKIGDGVTAWSSLNYFNPDSGSTSWGNITGTLSDQTDLQAALDAKADDSDVVTLQGLIDSLEDIVALKASITATTKNKFNPYKTIDNYYMGNDGGYAALSGHCVSDFIPVTPGVTYAGTVRFTCYFDSSRAVVSGGSNVQVSTFTVPVGVAYVKVTLSDVTQKFQFQLEVGSSNTLRFPGYQETENPPILPAKNLSNVRRTRNLFNKSTVRDNFYIDGSGNITSNSTYCYSDFIEIERGVTYYGHDGTDNMRFITYYDSNKDLVAIGDNLAHSTFNAPITSAVKYVIISVVKARKWAFQLEAGSALSFYQPFGIMSGNGVHGKNIVSNNSWYGGVMGSFGDSLTSQNTWQPIVADEIGVTLLNYGTSGTKVSDPAGTDATAMCRDERINAISTTCQLLTFLGGTNDWAQSIALGTIADTSPTTFYGALNTVALKLITRLPTTKIIWMTTPYGTYTSFSSPASPYETNNLGLRTSDYGACIMAVARLWGFPCVDLHGDSGINRINYTSLLTDRLHWNGLGSTRVARLILNKLQKIDMYP